jgi:hypothetical protein
MRSVVFLVGVLAAVVVVPASVATPPGSLAGPGVRVAPPVVHFGSVARGESRERRFSITNVGNEPLEFSRIAIPGFPVFTWRGQSDFFEFLENCPLVGPAVPVNLLPGDTCKVTVIAQPAASLAPGRYQGQFAVGTLGADDFVHVPLTVLVR